MIILTVLIQIAFNVELSASPFVHPGMLQNRQDLEFMKQKVAAGEEPWKTAWSNLCSESYSSLSFQTKPVAHVVRGPYGRPSIGDRDLIESANAAYGQAIQWVVTGDKIHAQKAIEIINAWSGTLWDFEDNDAKLLAAWTGHTFCNAAEILRYTDSGWKDRDVVQFKRMMLTIYYPLIKDYFPEANGNWDAAMMNSTLCIGIFCDDHVVFDSAVSHFERGPGNGGITKYIYPSGQCEESTRDQAHTQLGLGELSQACQVAWNQRIDLYGAADNRLALGMEYTARYLLGNEVPAYGIISPQGRDHFSDIYEGAYQHYHYIKAIEMPYTERAIVKTRARGSWSALTMYQGAKVEKTVPELPLQPSPFALMAGALNSATIPCSGHLLKVVSDELIQSALNAETNGGWVILDKGVFILSAPLRIPSGITLAGQGLDTVLILDPQFTSDRAGATIVNGDENLHNVTLRDFVIEGGTMFRTATNVSPDYTYVSGNGNQAVVLCPLSRDPNQDRRQRSFSMAPSRAGIIFDAQYVGEMHDLHFEHLTVRNCTHDGVAIQGAAQVLITACDFSDNGSSVAPGPGLQDDLLCSHVTACRITDSRLDDSPWGSGLRLSFASDVNITNNETARNARDGIDVIESRDIHICGNLAEGNDGGGIMADALMDGCRRLEITGNLARCNGGFGIKMDHVIGAVMLKNVAKENGTSRQIVTTESHSIKY